MLHPSPLVRAQPYTLRGFVPGVWRARAYLVAPGEEEHWKGGHVHTLGGEATGETCLML
jgi:hypothetical protein